MTSLRDPLAHVLAATGPVLLDFDGPVTHLFVDGRNRMVADRMRSVTLRYGVDLPENVRDTVDPLVVLRWAAAELPDHRQEIEEACIAGEVDAVAMTDPTAGSYQLLKACGATGRPVVIVSNNAPQTIDAYIERFGIAPRVAAVVARRFGRPDLMKPHPDSVVRALDLLQQPAGHCVLIGDSVTDIEVAHATGVHSIGYAKTPKRGDELARAGADATVDSMTTLAHHVAQSPSRSAESAST